MKKTNVKSTGRKTSKKEVLCNNEIIDTKKGNKSKKIESNVRLDLKGNTVTKKPTTNTTKSNRAKTKITKIVNEANINVNTKNISINDTFHFTESKVASRSCRNVASKDDENNSEVVTSSKGIYKESNKEVNLANSSKDTKTSTKEIKKTRKKSEANAEDSKVIGKEIKASIKENKAILKRSKRKSLQTKRNETGVTISTRNLKSKIQKNPTKTEVEFNKGSNREYTAINPIEECRQDILNNFSISTNSIEEEKDSSKLEHTEINDSLLFRKSLRKKPRKNYLEMSQGSLSIESPIVIEEKKSEKDTNKPKKCNEVEHIPVYKKMLQLEKNKKQLPKKDLYEFDEEGDERQRNKKPKISDLNDYDKNMDKIMEEVLKKMQKEKEKKSKTEKKVKIEKKVNFEKKIRKRNVNIQNEDKFEIQNSKKILRGITNETQTEKDLYKNEAIYTKSKKEKKNLDNSYSNKIDQILTKCKRKILNKSLTEKFEPNINSTIGNIELKSNTNSVRENSENVPNKKSRNIRPTILNPENSISFVDDSLIYDSFDDYVHDGVNNSKVNASDNTNCFGFDSEESNQNVRKENAFNINNKTPWRLNDLPLKRNPHFLSYKFSALPNYEQDIIIDSTFVENSIIGTPTLNKTPYRLDQTPHMSIGNKTPLRSTDFGGMISSDIKSNKNNPIEFLDKENPVEKHKQTSILNYLENSPVKLPENIQSRCSFMDADDFSPIKRIRSPLKSKRRNVENPDYQKKRTHRVKTTPCVSSNIVNCEVQDKNEIQNYFGFDESNHEERQIMKALKSPNSSKKPARINYKKFKKVLFENIGKEMGDNEVIAQHKDIPNKNDQDQNKDGEIYNDKMEQNNENECTNEEETNDLDVLDEQNSEAVVKVGLFEDLVSFSKPAEKTYNPKRTKHRRRYSIDSNESVLDEETKVKKRRKHVEKPLVSILQILFVKIFCKLQFIYI